MRLLASAQAIVELGHDAAADGRAELAERARALGNGDGEQRFVRFAELRALGDEAEAIEIHVRAAEHGDEPLAADALSRDPRLESGHGQRPGRLHHRAGVVEDVLDGRADLVVGHPHDFV